MPHLLRQTLCKLLVLCQNVWDNKRGSDRRPRDEFAHSLRSQRNYSVAGSTNILGFNRENKRDLLSECNCTGNVGYVLLCVKVLRLFQNQINSLLEMHYLGAVEIQ